MYYHCYKTPFTGEQAEGREVRLGAPTTRNGSYYLVFTSPVVNNYEE